MSRLAPVLYIPCRKLYTEYSLILSFFLLDSYNIDSNRLLEAALQLNMHVEPFRFFGSNIAAAVSAFSPAVLAGFEGRFLSPVTLPPSNNQELEAFLAAPSRIEVKGFETLIRQRSLVIYNADAIKLVHEAAFRQRYSWMLGKDPAVTRRALIAGLDSITENAPFDGPSLGRFGFDDNKDVLADIAQIVLRDNGFHTYISRPIFDAAPTAADVAAYRNSGVFLPQEVDCRAPLPPPRLDPSAATDSQEDTTYLGVLVGCLAGVLVIVLVVLLMQRRRKRPPSYNIMQWLKDNAKEPVWIPPVLSSDALRLEERIGEGAYAAVYAAGLLQQPGAMFRFDPQQREGARSGSYPPVPDVPALRAVGVGEGRRLRRVPIKVAVKQLKFLPNRGDYTLLMREVVAMAQLTGKRYIVQALGVTTSPQLTLVMEHCAYGSLDQLLLRAFMVDRPLTWQLKLRVATQLARGIDATHKWNLMHNDIAARNVLVSHNFVCKLADFGLARRVDFSATSDDRPRMPVRWTSPETLRGEFSRDNDIWALGVTLWEIAVNATGVPFGNLTEIGVIDAVCNDQQLPLPSNTPAELATLIQRCWLPAGARPTAIEMTTQLFAARLAFERDAPVEADGKRPVSIRPSLKVTHGGVAVAAATYAARERLEADENACDIDRSTFVDETYEDSDDEDSQRWRGEAAIHTFTHAPVTAKLEPPGWAEHNPIAIASGAATAKETCFGGLSAAKAYTGTVPATLAGYTSINSRDRVETNRTEASSSSVEQASSCETEMPSASRSSVSVLLPATGTGTGTAHDMLTSAGVEPSTNRPLQLARAQADKQTGYYSIRTDGMGTSVV